MRDMEGLERGEGTNILSTSTFRIGRNWRGSDILFIIIILLISIMLIGGLIKMTINITNYISYHGKRDIAQQPS